MPQQESKASEIEPLRRCEAGGISYLERPGDGETLVLLHGIGSNSVSFAPLLDGFAAGPRIIAWDAPGYLESQPLDKESPLAQDYADALDRFLDHLGLTAVHIVGHSLGTLIASAYVGRMPERVLSLSLAASAQGYGKGAGDPLPDTAVKRVEDLNRLGPEAFAKARAARLVFEPENNPDVVACVQEAMARVNPKGYAQAVHMLAAGDLAGSLAQLSIEPGFIIGAEDQITPMAQTEGARAAWAQVHGRQPRCIVIPAAGHAVYLQARAAFAEALIRLIPGLRPTTTHHVEGEHHGR